MKRRSSRGNPWHDEKGRFCHGPVAKIDTFGNEITDEQREEAHVAVVNGQSMMVEDFNDYVSSGDFNNDAENYYFAQTGERLDYARSVSGFTHSVIISENDTPEEVKRKEKILEEEYSKNFEKFRKEHEVAIRGEHKTHPIQPATIHEHRNMQTGEIRWTVCDELETENQVMKGLQSKQNYLIKDPTTNMRPDRGFVVLIPNRDEGQIESSAKDESYGERMSRMEAFMEKNKEALSDPHTHMVSWFDDKIGIQRFCLAKHYDTREEAQHFGDMGLNAKVIDCKNNQLVPRDETISKAEKGYKDFTSRFGGSTKTTKAKDGEVAFKDEKHNIICKIKGSKVTYIDSNTGEEMSFSRVRQLHQAHRDKIIQRRRKQKQAIYDKQS